MRKIWRRLKASIKQIKNAVAPKGALTAWIANLGNFTLSTINSEIRDLIRIVIKLSKWYTLSLIVNNTILSWILKLKTIQLFKSIIFIIGFIVIFKKAKELKDLFK